jgi:hypothetical protein
MHQNANHFIILVAFHQSDTMYSSVPSFNYWLLLVSPAFQMLALQHLRRRWMLGKGMTILMLKRS